mmetsp:Transcript_27145/g.26187  ORF Transcript_27145/g.26187 Transcript_27145/m.26187 type:complete len:100 (-) Transcript_27145:41-340(-)
MPALSSYLSFPHLQVFSNYQDHLDIFLGVLGPHYVCSDHFGPIREGFFFIVALHTIIIKPPIFITAVLNLILLLLAKETILLRLEHFYYLIVEYSKQST